MSKFAIFVAASALALGSFVAPASANYVWTQWEPGIAHHRANGTIDPGDVVFTGALGKVVYNQRFSNQFFDTGVLKVHGGRDTKDTITFPTWVTDPVLAIWGLGSNKKTAELQFSVPIEILSSVDDRLHLKGNDGVTGRNGTGEIELRGRFRSISWFDTFSKDQYFVSAGVYRSTVPVPEPGTIALFAAGLVGLGALGRRRRSKSA